MMNSSNLTGRLTKDPDLRYTPNGVAVATFTLAVNRPWTNQEGEREADFIQMVAFKGTAEAIGNYLTKGSLIGVEGRIQTRTYENDEGKTVWVTEVLVNQVHFLDSKKEEEPPKKNGYNKNKGGRK